MDSVLVPTIVDDMVFNNLTMKPKVGLSIVQSKYSGRGRREELRNPTLNPDTGDLLFKLPGLRYHKLDTGIKTGAAHTFNQSSWKSDITFLSHLHLDSMAAEQHSKLHRLIDLIAYEKPTLRVMEVDLGSAKTIRVCGLMEQMRLRERPTVSTNF